MSTRANVVVKDEFGEVLWFYRHSDGYPSVTANSLRTFLRWLLDGKIRNNVSQAAGWLVVLGHLEYSGDPHNTYHPPIGQPVKSMCGWKVGAYEPTCGCHGDIEFAYLIDLGSKTITCHRPRQVPVEGKSWTDASFDPADPSQPPLLTITAENIDEPIKEAVEVG